MIASRWLFAMLLVASSSFAADSVVVGTDSASGNTIISTGPRRTDVLIPVDGTAERVCWFEGHKSPQGPRTRAGEEWIDCARENDYETNGSLSWRAAAELSQQSGSKIQIN